MYLLAHTFFKGLLFGITMAAIPGPIFFLIMQRTLAHGVLTGLFCGLGAVTADAVYAFIAAVGLTCISHFLLTYQLWLTIVGGLFLIYLGIKTYNNNNKQAAQITTTPHTHHSSSYKKLSNAWFTTFLLTLTNPVTIVSYSVIFAGLGIHPSTNTTYTTLFTLIVGLILGALGFVAVLISFLHHFRRDLSPRTIALLNKTAGIVLIGFGIAALFRTIHYF